MRENMLGYLSTDIICSEKRTVFREQSSRKTVSYEEQIMSKDKYPSIFSPQMEAIVFIILQIFYATRTVLKIGKYLTIILRNRVEYRLILSRQGRILVPRAHDPSGLRQELRGSGSNHFRHAP